MIKPINCTYGCSEVFQKTGAGLINNLKRKYNCLRRQADEQGEAGTRDTEHYYVSDVSLPNKVANDQYI